MQRTEIDGITTIWEQGPEPFSGALVFGVGTRHETFRTAQVAHLVEHLVMSTMPKSHLDHNARVEIDTTTFHATGPRDAVVDFLARVCRALADLPLDHMAREAGVLDAEEGTSEHPALCWALGRRFGRSGPGLLNSSGPGPKRLTAEHVRDFATRHFVRDNAVLVLTGPPPEGLRLSLPTGPRPAEEPGRTTALPLPALVRDDIPHPTLSFTLPREEWSGSLVRILAERVLDDIRHRRGIAYEVDLATARLDADRTIHALFTDGHEDQAGTIAATIWAALQDLADRGPAQEELDHDRAGFAAYLDDPRASLDWLEGLAYRHLHGDPLWLRDECRERFAAVAVADVQRWARQAVDSALLGVPGEGTDELTDGLPGLPDRTEWEPPSHPGVEGTRFSRRLLALSPRDLAVTAGDAGIAQTAVGRTVGATWDQVVGVASAPGIRLVLLDSGEEFLLWQRHLKDTDRLFALVDERTRDVSFEAPEKEILED
jgi:hypothetical protein